MSGARRAGFALALVLSATIAALLGLRVGRTLVERSTPAELDLGAASAGATAWLDIPAPDVEFATAEGSLARLADYRGQIVLLNFWGSWCPPCLVEIPHLIRVQESLRDLGGTIIGPAVDSGSGEDVLRFAREHGINYPVWLANYDISVGRFGAAGYPFTLLIDRGGIIRKTYLGPQTERTLLRDVGALAIDFPARPEQTMGAG